MTQEEKLEALAEALDRDIGELKPEANLDSLGWDSMSMLSVIAMAKTLFNKKITGAQRREVTTVQDVLSALEQ